MKVLFGPKMTWIAQEKLTQIENLMLKIAEYGRLLFFIKLFNVTAGIVTDIIFQGRIIRFFVGLKTQQLIIDIFDTIK